ncbi:MAG TPA: alpha/beta hydrolase [Nitriliruptorales bacterium]
MSQLQLRDVTVERDGHPIAAVDFGGSDQGRPLVLVHGGSRNAMDWLGVAPYLTAEHRVVAVDVRGHGRTPLGAGLDIAECAEDVHAIVEALGLDGAIVAGQSLGGMIATAYGRAHPEVAGVVNIDGSGQALPSSFPGSDDEAALRRQLQQLLRDQVQAARDRQDDPDDTFAEKDVPGLVSDIRASAQQAGLDPDVIEAGARRGAVRTPAGRWRQSWGNREQAAMLAGVLAYDTLAELRALTCPAMYVMGDAEGRDDGGLGEAAVPFQLGLKRDLAEFAAEAGRRLESLPTGHMVHLEMPEQTARLLHEFAASV